MYTKARLLDIYRYTDHQFLCFFYLFYICQVCAQIWWHGMYWLWIVIILSLPRDFVNVYYVVYLIQKQCFDLGVCNTIYSFTYKMLNQIDTGTFMISLVTWNVDLIFSSVKEIWIISFSSSNIHGHATNTYINPRKSSLLI